MPRQLFRSLSLFSSRAYKCCNAALLPHDFIYFILPRLSRHGLEDEIVATRNYWGHRCNRFTYKVAQFLLPFMSLALSDIAPRQLKHSLLLLHGYRRTEHRERKCKHMPPFLMQHRRHTLYNVNRRRHNTDANTKNSSASKCLHGFIFICLCLIFNDFSGHYTYIYIY